MGKERTDGCPPVCPKGGTRPACCDTSPDCPKGGKKPDCCLPAGRTPDDACGTGSAPGCRPEEQPPRTETPKRSPLRLPGSLDTGDLLLLLILFLIWLEKEDEEILILLSALLVMSL